MVENISKIEKLKMHLNSRLQYNSNNPANEEAKEEELKNEYVDQEDAEDQPDPMTWRKEVEENKQDNDEIISNEERV